MLFDHAGARPGRSNNILELFEGIDNKPRNIFGVFGITGIIGGLTTTSLAFRYKNLAAGIFEPIN
jgi:hypothetical protein